MFLVLACPKEKKLEVPALTIVNQFGVDFNIMFLVVQYQDYWLRSSFSSVVERDLPSLTEDLKMYCLSTEDLLFGFRSYYFGQRGYCFENDQQ